MSSMGTNCSHAGALAAGAAWARKKRGSLIARSLLVYRLRVDEFSEWDGFSRECRRGRSLPREAARLAFGVGISLRRGVRDRGQLAGPGPAGPTREARTASFAAAILSRTLCMKSR